MCLGTVHIKGLYVPTIGWMRQFNGVSRARSGSDTGSKAEDETTPDELAQVVCRSLNGGTDEDNETAYEYTDSSAVPISQETAN